MLAQKAKELESHIAQFGLSKRQLEDDLRRLKDEGLALKQELLAVTSAKNQEIADLS